MVFSIGFQDISVVNTACSKTCQYVLQLTWPSVHTLDHLFQGQLTIHVQLLSDWLGATSRTRANDRAGLVACSEPKVSFFPCAVSAGSHVSCWTAAVRRICRSHSSLQSTETMELCGALLGPWQHAITSSPSRMPLKG